jgi:capsular polysaccharide biosynthesis protein
MIILRKKQTVVGIILLFLISAVVITFVQPLKYASESRVLVIQNFAPETDPYLISKSNEYVSTVLSQVVGTNIFFNDVITSSPSINKNYFTADPRDQMKIWNNTVSAAPVADTGIINITVYHKDKKQADLINRTIDDILQSKHQNYHGSGANLQVVVLNQPLVSKYPAKPNIFLNLIAGLIFGLICALIYVYLSPEEEIRIKLQSKSEKKVVVPENIKEVIRENVTLKLPELNINQNSLKTSGYTQPVETKKYEEYDDLEIKNFDGNMKNIFGQPK